MDYRDYHVWLVVNQGDPKSKALVVEVTPRVHDQRSGWSASALSSLKGEHVRISGWLLLDQEHPEQLGHARATLWEIHPIIHIEVDKVAVGRASMGIADRFESPRTVGKKVSDVP